MGCATCGSSRLRTTNVRQHRSRQGQSGALLSQEIPLFEPCGTVTVSEEPPTAVPTWILGLLAALAFFLV